MPLHPRRGCESEANPSTQIVDRKLAFHPPVIRSELVVPPFPGYKSKTRTPQPALALRVGLKLTPLYRQGV